MALSIIINKAAVAASFTAGTKVADIVVSGGTSPYSYSLASGGDYFQIEETEVRVIADMNIDNIQSFSVFAEDSTSVESVSGVSEEVYPNITAKIQSRFNSAGKIYKITQDIDLGHGVLTIPANCTLDFQGGSFSNGIIIGTRTSITSNDITIFNNTKLTGNFLCHSFKASWFGVSQKNDDNSTAIQNAIDSIMVSNTHILEFGAGTFRIRKNIEIGITDGERQTWGVIIRGAGSNYTNGTTFLLDKDVYIKINQANYSYGSLRQGGIFDICFSSITQATSSSRGLGLVINYCQCYEIKRCSFMALQRAIGFTGSAYFTLVESCAFENCDKGVYVLDLEDELYESGDSNNDIINNCYFTYCTIPISLGGSNNWMISNSDIEGHNGTIYLGRYNYMSNVRIERNIDDIWLHMIEGCNVDCNIYAAGGSSANYRIQIIGDNNKIKAFISGFNPYSIISEGKNNYFNIVQKNGTNAGYMNLYFMDPDDTIIINGVSNRNNKEGINLISQKLPIGDILINEYLGEEAYNLMHTIEANYIYQIPLRAHEAFNSLYITFKFCTQNEINSLVFHSNTEFPENLTINKWYQVIGAVDSTNQALAENANFLMFSRLDINNISVVDVTLSETLLFNIPILSSPDTCSVLEHNTVNLKNTYVNNVLSDCRKNFPTRTLRNKLGKEFYCIDNTYINTEGNKIVSATSEVGLLQHLLTGKLEIWSSDFTQYYSVKFERNSTSDLFTFNDLYKNGEFSIISNNYGTISVTGMNSNRIYWVTSFTTTTGTYMEGQIVYDSELKKMKLWNGTAWVNLDGTALADTKAKEEIPASQDITY